jgi:phage-related minor tail protein
MYKFIAMIYKIMSEWFMSIIVFSLATLKKQKEAMVEYVNRVLDAAADPICEFYDDAVEVFTEIFDNAAKRIKNIASVSIFSKQGECHQTGIFQKTKVPLKSTEPSNVIQSKQLSPDVVNHVTESTIVAYVIERVQESMRIRRAEFDAEFEKNREKERAEVKAEIEKERAEFKAEIEKLQAEFKAEIEKERAEFKAKSKQEHLNSLKDFKKMIDQRNQECYYQDLVKNLNFDLFRSRYCLPPRAPLLLIAPPESDAQQVKRSAPPGC